MEDLTHGSKMLADKLINLSKSKDMKNAVQSLKKPTDLSIKSDMKTKVSCQDFYQSWQAKEVNNLIM